MSATLAPVSADFTMSMRGAPIAPYQPYMPIPGRIVGMFNGESRSRFAMADGKLRWRSPRARAGSTNLELRAPGATAGPIKIARVAIDGIDFTHPGKAAAKTITITKPNSPRRARRERRHQHPQLARRRDAADHHDASSSRPRADGGSEDAARDDAGPRVIRPVHVAPAARDRRHHHRGRRTRGSSTAPRSPRSPKSSRKLAVRVDNLSSQPGKPRQAGGAGDRRRQTRRSTSRARSRRSASCTPTSPVSCATSACRP